MASRNTPGTSSSSLTKDERREAAREAARKLRIEEAKRAKRNRILAIIASLVVVALVATAVFVIVNSKSKQSAILKGADGTPQYAKFTAGESAFTGSLPANVEKNGGISVGASLTAGSKNEGKPTVDIYFDYLCVHCNDLEAQFGEALTEMAKEGEITLVYHPVEIMHQAFSTHSAAADFFVAQNAPDKYIEFHNKVFSDLSNPVFKEQASLPTTEDLIKVAKDVGVNDDVASRLEKALNSESLTSLVEQASKQFANDGLTGTPAVIVNGRQLLNWNTALAAAIKEAA